MKVYMEVIKEDDCTGCSACKNICPVDAITMKEDHEGFWDADVDGQKCVSCEKCIHVCPISCEKTEFLLDRCRNNPLIFAAQSQDQDIRYYSTSGGIFSELALEVLGMDGYICGAVYDEEQNVRHDLTREKEELKRIRQSKYVQSDMGKIYREIEMLLDQKQKILFCGSPCQ